MFGISAPVAYTLSTAAGIMDTTLVTGVYIVSAIRGATRPSRMTWFIWALTSSAIALSSWLGTTRLDIICLILAMISIILGYILQSPLIILLGNVLAGAIGSIPTIRHTYLMPADESTSAWALDFFVVSLNLIAVREWTLIIALEPVTIWCIVITVLLLSVRRSITGIFLKI